MTGFSNWRRKFRTWKVREIQSKPKRTDMKKLDLSSIQSKPLSADQYYPEITNKRQIVLHHTVSGRGVKGDINWWQTDPKRIATCVIVDHSGVIYQLFSSKYWAHHIGIKSSVLKDMGYDDYSIRNKILNQQSIGIEIDNWGWLVKKNNSYYSYTGVEVPKENVQYYEEGYRGYNYFEKYTDKQIESVRQLLVYWSERYDIPLDYNNDMFGVSRNAIDGKKGVWSHTSYRSDKTDVHPQSELVKMLKTI